MKNIWFKQIKNIVKSKFKILDGSLKTSIVMSV